MRRMPGADARDGTEVREDKAVSRYGGTADQNEDGGNGMKLYEIDEKIMEAFDRAIDAETGEILDAQAFAELDSLQVKRDEKIEGALLWIKNLSAEVEVLKAEKQAFESRQRQAANKAETLKRYISGVLNSEKFKTAKVSVTWRKSEAAEFDGNVFSLPEDCLTYKEPTVNKAELKKRLKAGEKIEGAQLVVRNNIQIK